MQISYSSQGLSFAIFLPGGANIFFLAIEHLRTSTFRLAIQEGSRDANDDYSGFCFNREACQKDTIFVYWKGNRGNPHSPSLKLVREYI